MRPPAAPGASPRASRLPATSKVPLPACARMVPPPLALLTLTPTPAATLTPLPASSTEPPGTRIWPPCSSTWPPWASSSSSWSTVSRPPERVTSPLALSEAAASEAGSLTRPARPARGSPLSWAAWAAVVRITSNMPPPTRKPVAVLSCRLGMLTKPTPPPRWMPPGESQISEAGELRPIGLSRKLPRGFTTPTTRLRWPWVSNSTLRMPPRVSKAAKRWKRLGPALVPPPIPQSPAPQLPPNWPFTRVPSDRTPPLAVISPASPAGTTRPASPRNTRPARPGSSRCTGRFRRDDPAEERFGRGLRGREERDRAMPEKLPGSTVNHHTT